ncbi:MAG: sugar phosphate isomerase/epimerase [Lawsonibacter sp.]|nr:sugar phosphate isomerase/epimerase [Lawsonibacter sp.]
MRIKETLDQYGIKTQVVGGFSFRNQSLWSIDVGDEAYRRTLDELARQIELAKLLDCGMIRSLVFSKQACLWGGGGAELRNGYNNKSWPKMLRLFEPLVQMAEDAGMDIVFETGVNTVLTSGWLNRKFVEDMGSRHLKIIWDPANMLINREYPPSVYEEIKDLIGHVHIKDGVYDADRSTITATAVGQGDMREYMSDIARWLKRDGYQGVVSIENFYIPEGKTTEEGYLAGVEEFKRIFGTE